MWYVAALWLSDMLVQIIHKRMTAKKKSTEKTQRCTYNLDLRQKESKTACTYQTSVALFATGKGHVSCQQQHFC